MSIDMESNDYDSSDESQHQQDSTSRTKSDQVNVKLNKSKKKKLDNNAADKKERNGPDKSEQADGKNDMYNNTAKDINNEKDTRKDINREKDGNIEEDIITKENIEKDKKKLKSHAKVDDVAKEKETANERDEGWQRVEYHSSDETGIESDASGSGITECEIIVPLKLLDSDATTQETNIGTQTNVETLASVVEDKEKESPVLDIEDKNKNNNQDLITLDSDSDGAKNQKKHRQVVNTEKVKVVKKKKYKLYNGFESSGDETMSQQPQHEKVQNKFDENSTKHPSVRKLSVEQPSLKDYSARPSSTKEYTSTEEARTNAGMRKDNVMSVRRGMDYNTSMCLSPVKDTRGNNITFTKTKKTMRCIPEEESSDELIEHEHACHYKKRRVTSPPLGRSFPCTSGPSHHVVSSPNSLARKKRALENMLKEKERKMKLKMIRLKQMKQVLAEIFDSDDTSSDELSYALPTFEEVPRMKRKHCSHERCAVDTKDDVIRDLETQLAFWKKRDLERQVEYWKNKKSKPEVTVSPRRLRNLQEEVNYWKAASQSHREMPSTSHAIGRTSTPVQVEEDEVIPCTPPRVMSRTASVDSILHNPSLLAEPKSRPAKPREEVHRTNLRRQGTLESSTDLRQDRSSRPFSRAESCSNLTENEGRHSLANQPGSVLFRTKFTEKEKEQILRYIVKNYHMLELIKGKSYWIQMAHSLDTHRTWQSIKNNFFTNIMKNLEKYDIPDKVRNKLISVARNYM